MKKYFFLIAIPLLLTSCATIFSKKNYQIQIQSNAENAKVKIYDSIYNLPASVSVKRSKNDLTIVFINDTVSKNHILKSRISPKFIVGNLFFYPPFSYLIDFNNEKRFYYGKMIFIDIKDTSKVIKRMSFQKKVHYAIAKNYQDQKGKFKLTVSIPWINSFYFPSTAAFNKSSTGFLGISGGLDYFYKKNKFLAFNASAITDFFVPIPVPVSYREMEWYQSVNYSISDNYNLNRFTYGYGISYAIHNWRYYNQNEENEFSTAIVEIDRKTYNFGFLVNGYYQLSDNFYVGLVYKPTIFQINSGSNFKYEYTLSLDLSWKINLNK